MDRDPVTSYEVWLGLLLLLLCCCGKQLIACARATWRGALALCACIQAAPAKAHDFFSSRYDRLADERNEDDAASERSSMAPSVASAAGPQTKAGSGRRSGRNTVSRTVGPLGAAAAAKAAGQTPSKRGCTKERGGRGGSGVAAPPMVAYLPADGLPLPPPASAPGRGGAGGSGKRSARPTKTGVPAGGPPVRGAPPPAVACSASVPLHVQQKIKYRQQLEEYERIRLVGGGAGGGSSVSNLANLDVQAAVTAGEVGGSTEGARAASPRKGGWFSSLTGGWNPFARQKPAKEPVAEYQGRPPVKLGAPPRAQPQIEAVDVAELAESSPFGKLIGKGPAVLSEDQQQKLQEEQRELEMELAEQQIDDPDERERVIAEIEAKDREAKRQAEQKKVEAQKEAERLASEPRQKFTLERIEGTKPPIRRAVLRMAERPQVKIEVPVELLRNPDDPVDYFPEENDEDRAGINVDQAVRDSKSVAQHGEEIDLLASAVKAIGLGSPGGDEEEGRREARARQTPVGALGDANAAGVGSDGGTPSLMRRPSLSGASFGSTAAAGMAAAATPLSPDSGGRSPQKVGFGADVTFGSNLPHRERKVVPLERRPSSLSGRRGAPGLPREFDLGEDSEDEAAVRAGDELSETPQDSPGESSSTEPSPKGGAGDRGGGGGRGGGGQAARKGAAAESEVEAALKTATDACAKASKTAAAPSAGGAAAGVATASADVRARLGASGHVAASNTGCFPGTTCGTGEGLSALFVHPDEDVYALIEKGGILSEPPRAFEALAFAPRAPPGEAPRRRTLDSDDDGSHVGGPFDMLANFASAAALGAHRVPPKVIPRGMMQEASAQATWQMWASDNLTEAIGISKERGGEDEGEEGDPASAPAEAPAAAEPGKGGKGKGKKGKGSEGGDGKGGKGKGDEGRDEGGRDSSRPASPHNDSREDSEAWRKVHIDYRPVVSLAARRAAASGAPSGASSPRLDGGASPVAGAPASSKGGAVMDADMKKRAKAAGLRQNQPPPAKAKLKK